jgi:hypothetical protein
VAHERDRDVNLLIGVVVVLVLVATIAICRRLIGFRSDEHAMESYEHALDVLGDASRRNDSQRVRIIPPEEVAKAHIRSTDGDADLVPRPGAAADVPPPRIRLEPPVLPGVTPGEPLAFGTPRFGTPAVPYSIAGASASTSAPMGARAGGDAPADGEAAAGATVRGAARDGATETEPAPGTASVGGGGGGDAGGQGDGSGSGPSRRRPGSPSPVRSGPRARASRSRAVVDPAHERRVRRAATGGMAVVAAAAVAVAALQLAGGPAKGNAAKGGTSSHGSGPLVTELGGSTTTTSPVVTTTTTSVPSSIIPEDSSATDVAYRAPATTYTVTFQASGPCWVGVQQTAGGPWVWEETIEAGAAQTYSASGSVIVRLGAPPKIKVSVDGITLQLPPSNVQPYDLTFTPDS